MMNPATNIVSTQPTTAIASPLPTPEPPQFPLDPSNPLVWILLMTALLGNADEVINAVTGLIRAIASLKRGDRKGGDREGGDRSQ